MVFCLSSTQVQLSLVFLPSVSICLILFHFLFLFLFVFLFLYHFLLFSRILSFSLAPLLFHYIIMMLVVFPCVFPLEYRKRKKISSSDLFADGRCFCDVLLLLLLFLPKTFVNTRKPRFWGHILVAYLVRNIP